MVQTVETLKFLLLYKSVSQVNLFLLSDYRGFPINRGNFFDRRVSVSTSVSGKSFEVVRSIWHHDLGYLLLLVRDAMREEWWL